MAESLELQRIADRLNARLPEHRENDISHFINQLLEGVNDEAEGFGVKGTLNEEKGIDIQYINMGDAYNQTILYDGIKGKFLVSTWGDLMEEQEREYELTPEPEPTLSEIAERLTRERSDEEYWNEYHPGATPDDVLEEYCPNIGGYRVSEVFERGRDIELLYADMRDSRKETLVYDAVGDVFLAESLSSVLERKNREYGIERARFGNIARRLNRELGDFEEWGGMKRSDVIGYMLTGALDEVGGGKAAEADSGLYLYIERDGRRAHTLFYDAEADKFLSGDLDTLRGDRAIERERREDEAANPVDGQNGENQGRDTAGIDAIHLAAREGLAVYIGEEQYYVRSTNKYFANLYPMAELDALPDEIGGQPVDWEALKGTPFLLTGEIRWNRLRVTDCFLEIEDFRDAVIGSARNAEIIEKMGLTPPERDDLTIPVPQTNGSPYYSVGDKVFLDGDQQAEIKAVGEMFIWYEETPGDSDVSSGNGATTIMSSLRAFGDKFFSNPLNKEAIEQGEWIERSGGKEIKSSVNLPALVLRLNRECEDRQAWEKANPGKTVQDWLEGIALDIDYASYGPLGEPQKGTDLWRIDLKGRDESLFYDYIGQKFISGKTADVLRLKEGEHIAYLERLGSLAERLNVRLAALDENGAPELGRFVTDLLAEANAEIRGDGVLVSADEERGVYIRYADKHENPYIPTILYDGHEGKFLAGSLNYLEKKQEREHDENQEKEYDLNYGHMGNGLTVWNRLEERNGDYVTIAHISPDREVNFYEDSLPEDVKEQILYIARTSDARISSTQDMPVFSTPPQEKEQQPDAPEPEPETNEAEPGESPVFYGTQGENHEAFWKSHELNCECARALGKAFIDHHKNNRLNMDAVLEDIKGYSAERISVVLANTMRYRESDGRFSSDNWKWQKNIALPESALTHYTGVSSHSILVDYLVTTIRELEKNRAKEPEIASSSPPSAGAVKTAAPEAPVKSILDGLDWPKPRNKTEEFRQEFTKKIISLMEQGEAFWQKPWKSPDTGLPMNAVSGKRYNGVNIAYLMVAGLNKGYSDPRWMTYKQAEEKGWHVMPGEHGTKVEFYTEYDPSKTKKGADILDQKIQSMMDRGASQEEIEKAMEDQKVLIAKTYTVFNASQVEGIEPLRAEAPEAGSEFRPHDRAEAIMDNCGAHIQYGQNRAFYSPSRDVIGMPNKEWFNTPEHFYVTMLHEIAHSTGHPSRMNREDLSNPFGSEAYALEELRAEMASAFMFQEIGMNLSSEDMEGYVQDHAAYTQSWLGKLKDDYKEFFKAVRDATKIADYTLAYEQTRVMPNGAPDLPETAGEPFPSSITPETTSNPIQAAKEIIGQGAIVTNAQPGRDYTGEILRVGQGHAIQKISADRAIIHDLNRIGDSNGLTALLKLPKDDRRVSISYDKDRNAIVKTNTRDEEREAAQTR